MAEAGRRKRQQKDNGTTVDGAKTLLGIGAIIVLIGIGTVAFWLAGSRSSAAVTRQPVAQKQLQVEQAQLPIQQVQPQIQQAQQPQVQAVPTQTQEAQPPAQAVPAQVQPAPQSQRQAAAAEATSLRQAQDSAADLAPDLTLATQDGEFQLSQKRGNVVILYFAFVG